MGALKGGARAVEWLAEATGSAGLREYRGRYQGRRCVVRTPFDSFADIGVVHRLRREAFILARLGHPVLPEMFRLEDEQGVPFLVTEEVAGESLRERDERGYHWSAGEITDLASAMFGVLAAIHECGTFHGAVIEQNVLIERESGAVRLLGFWTHKRVPDADAWRAQDSQPHDPQVRDFVGLARILKQCLGAEGSGECDQVRALRVFVAKLELERSNVDVTQLAQALRAVPRAVPALHPPACQTLVGRRKELASLEQVLAEKAGVALVWGTQGGGKSRLLDEFLRTAYRTGRSWLVCRCRAWEPRPFGVVRQLVEALVARLPDASPAGLRGFAGQHAALLKILVPGLASVLGESFEAPPLDDEEGAYTKGLASFLEVSLQRQAVQLVVVDDVHWIDESSGRVLRRVMKRVSTAFVFASRDGGSAGAHTRRFLRGVELGEREIALPIFDVSEAAELVGRYLGGCFVSEEHRRALAHLSDGSPLATLEVVRAVVDAGLLVPRDGVWLLDASQVVRMRLPDISQGILMRRVAALGMRVAEVLALAAAGGKAFSVEVLSRLLGSEQVALALASAEEAHLIRSCGPSRFAFVHDSVHEAVLSSVEVETGQRHHRLLAEALGVSSSAQELELMASDEVCELARHCVVARGLDRASVSRVTYEAGKRAFDAFDNVRALEFLSASETHSVEPVLAPGLMYHLAEVEFRTGNFQASLPRFAAAEVCEKNPVRRALMLARMAQMFEGQFDDLEALVHCERAMVVLGASKPRISAAGVLHFAAAAVLRPKQPTQNVTDSDERERLTVLSAVYFQCFRVAGNAHQISTMLGAGLACLVPALRLGTSPALARARSVQGAMLAALGFASQAKVYLLEAQRVAEKTKQPAVVAHCTVTRVAVLCWAGDTQGALGLAESSYAEYGDHFELMDHCMLACTIAMLEGLKGRGQLAWSWLARVLERLPFVEKSLVAGGLLAGLARATATQLGRLSDYAPQIALAGQSDGRVPPTSGYYAIVFGARVRELTERGELGQPFETLVKEFEAMKQNPRRSHPAVSDYYVHVAQARVHACWQARGEVDDGMLEHLRVAAKELKLAARWPLVRAHSHSVQAALAFLDGKTKLAELELLKAEELAREQGAPWVLYAVARCRAHLLRACGNLEASVDQARIAAALAHEHGAAYRLRWIQQEFGIAVSTSHQLGEGTNLTGVRAETPPKHERHVQALLDMSIATQGNQEPRSQAALLLNFVVVALRAQRGFLFLRDANESAGLRPPTFAELDWVVTCEPGTDGQVAVSNYDRQSAIKALATERVVLHQGNGPAGGAGVSVVAAPLLVGGQIMGVVLLDRQATEEGFDERDGEVLRALAGQIPVALELGHAWRERERLSDELRQSQKMEAVGRLAGGIAHDFNNMLAAISISTDAVLAAPTSSHVIEDLQTIKGAAERASNLTRQLLAFSRRQVLDPRPVDLNGVVRELVPMLRRLLGTNTEIEHYFCAELHLVKVDRGHLDQALVNLAVNARDAMSGGGKLTLSTRNVAMSGPASPGGLTGNFAVLTIEDTGVGMDSDTRDRVFEPFFTTKDQEAGTGLGLSMVYGFVAQSGGQVQVQSSLGEGSSFELWLPETAEGLESIRPRALPQGAGGGSESILLVEDEALVRSAIARVLRRLGYRVTEAASGHEALLQMDSLGQVDLVVTDLVMPSMSGADLVRELHERGVVAHVLFISGYAGGVETAGLSLSRGVDFLQKPAAQKELARAVRTLLNSEAALSKLGG